MGGRVGGKAKGFPVALKLGWVNCPVSPISNQKGPSFGW